MSIIAFNRFRLINKLNTRFGIIFLLVILLQSHAISDQHENTSSEYLSEISMNVLKATEEALVIYRVNPTEALNYVNMALKKIDTIDSLINNRTVTSIKKEKNTSIATRYSHGYPRLDQTIFEYNSELPTLSRMLRENIIYTGEINKKSGQIAFFDYSLAKASLKTARNAIESRHSLETIRALNWVFEAVYVQPSFDITAY